MSVRILVGDVRRTLAGLPADSVQTCVTSPPYFGLRDYGVAGQIGLEPTPSEYVAEMAAVFREVRRVLRDDGTLWLNLGDSYAGGRTGRWDEQNGREIDGKPVRVDADAAPSRDRPVPAGAKPKDLLGMPWRVAFALQADGWWLRSDVVWHKPNPMPESVTDRPTKAHEYVFLLTKAERYYYDADAIAEPVTEASVARLSQNVAEQAGSARANGGARTERPMRAVGGRPQRRRAEELAAAAGLTEEHIAAIRATGITDAGRARLTQNGTDRNSERVRALAAEAKAALGGYFREFLIPENRNARSVWTIATQPYGGAHFATMPPALAERCIRAGSRPGDTVLDPFGGAGTTGLVADRLGRDAVLCELNPKYAALAEARIRGESTLLADVTLFAA